MTNERSLESIPDRELLHRLAQLVNNSRGTEGEIISHIAEVDARRLYAREACPSMYVYGTNVLHFSEAEAYLRITVARAAREHPVLLEMLAEGRLHLSGIVRLTPYLTLENRDLLLERATHRSKRQILEMIAELAPKPDVRSRMRKLPSPRVAASASSPSSGPAESVSPELCPARVPDSAASGVAAPPSAVVPLAPQRYKVQFTASAELHDKLERLKALMRSKVPDGDLAAIIEAAVSEKLERLEAGRFGATRAPRSQLSTSNLSPGSRHISAAVKRAVSARDGRQCTYRDAQGRRCPARERLEYHHRHPFGFGGGRGPENIVLVCKRHNALLAEHDYGPKAMARRRRGRERPGEESIARVWD